MLNSSPLALATILLQHRDQPASSYILPWRRKTVNLLPMVRHRRHHQLQAATVAVGQTVNSIRWHQSVSLCSLNWFHNLNWLREPKLLVSHKTRLKLLLAPNSYRIHALINRKSIVIMSLKTCSCWIRMRQVVLELSYHKKKNRHNRRSYWKSSRRSLQKSNRKRRKKKTVKRLVFIILINKSFIICTKIGRVRRTWKLALNEAAQFPR
jgi:hypothetical protein